MVGEIGQICEFLKLMGLDLRKVKYIRVDTSKITNEFIQLLLLSTNTEIILFVANSEKDAEKVTEITNSLFPDKKILSIITDEKENNTVTVIVEKRDYSQQNPPTLL
ncbi:hypothetical protein [Stygiolobus caldivivus]|uniref:Uncharacterized protein n=1 Tax=Stygiolobus caldivivus TaxID=2824673 RepID=A0A8D5U4K2_9CREN|nr:hypothetical protein [Stygiolobus caldivivus]BCU68811.1 hypothetical protein KN1_01080 [Stygiolobus caldivivus]